MSRLKVMPTYRYEEEIEAMKLKGYTMYEALEGVYRAIMYKKFELWKYKVQTMKILRSKHREGPDKSCAEFAQRWCPCYFQHI